MKSKNIDLPISEVVLLEDRAKIKRIGKLTLSEGYHTLLLPNVSPVISDKTLYAKITDLTEVKISDVRIKRSLRNISDSDSDKFTDLKNKIKELENRKTVLMDKQSVLLSRVDSSETILDLLFQEISVDAAWDKMPGSDDIGVIDELEEGVETSELKLIDIQGEFQELSRNLEDLKNLADTLKTPATEYSADIIIDIEASKELSFRLIVEYLVPQACWRPRYRAELLDGSFHFSMEGNVWQNTGEEWKNVNLLFSTQRVLSRIEPSLLVEDSIYLQKKSKDEIIEERDQEIQEAGLGSSSAGMTEYIPGIDDCGAVQNLHASGQYTIPSNGFPYRVGIADYKSEYTADLIAFPELSDYVFLRTKHINNMQLPILAGPVDLIRNSGLAGRSSVLFISPGEDFEITWGPDPDLRINRVESEIDEKTSPLRPWAQKRYRIIIRISNLGIQNKKILIQERIPVSEVEKIQVIFDQEKTSPGFSLADKNGILSWKRELPSMGRDKVVLEFTIRRHKAVIEAGSPGR